MFFVYIAHGAHGIHCNYWQYIKRGKVQNMQTYFSEKTHQRIIQYTHHHHHCHHDQVKPLVQWEKLDMSSLERRKLCCSVTFHAVSIITAIMWSWWQMWSIMIMIMRRRRRSNIMAKALCTSISLSHCLNTNIVFSLRHLYHLVWKPPPLQNTRHPFPVHIVFSFPHFLVPRLP